MPLSKEIGSTFISVPADSEGGLVEVDDCCMFVLCNGSIGEIGDGRTLSMIGFVYETI